MDTIEQRVEPPEVGDIVRDYLKDNGYDGLCGDECGCSIDNLFPCSGPFVYCRPAYKWVCPGPDTPCRTDWCECLQGDDCFRQEPQLFSAEAQS